MDINNSLNGSFEIQVFESMYTFKFIKIDLHSLNDIDKLMTKNIFIIGAGRSTPALIKYLVELSFKENIQLTIADKDFRFLPDEFADHERVKTIFFDVFDADQRALEIQKADLVISMLPAHLHLKVAKDCVAFTKPMVTASYVSKEIRSLHEKATQKGVLLLNEMGLDPGLDHMSAMKIIDEIKSKGGSLKSFKSFCGGLIAPDSDTNPWQYKFTWNPRNVILAGQGTAKYLEGGQYKYIPYHQLFQRTTPVRVPHYGDFEAYANRDSISYRSIYQLNDVTTLLRGTLRRPGFAEAWNLFVQMGMTDDSYEMNVSAMTYRSFFTSFLMLGNRSIEDCLKSDFGASNLVVEKVKWLGFFEDTSIELFLSSPAQVLQKLLEVKWRLDASDKDMIVMQHQFTYELESEIHELHSSLVLVGHDQIQTAMSMTVGLPLAIAAKRILKGEIKTVGVALPVSKEMYLPVLAELEQFGIQFIEQYVSKV
jgi:saccharopine dehydrogenase-like NADP-dependent oxidoreductase